MFAKQGQVGNNIKHVFYLIKRNYDLKKLSIQAEKNPYLKNIMENKMKKREPLGTLQRIIDKR